MSTLPCPTLPTCPRPTPPISKIIRLFGIHSIIHGAYGCALVATSLYVNYSSGINNTFLAANIILIILGIAAFCVVLWRRPLCIRLFATLVFLHVLLYLISGIIYFKRYFPFYANSLGDKALYYSEVECWVGPDYALTIWHVLTAIAVFLIFIWFIYAALLCKHARSVCLIPCPPDACIKPPPPTCRTLKWYHRLFKPNPCPPLPICPPPPCPCPPCPQPPPPCPVPCKKEEKKGCKLVLTLKPSKLCK